jgi:hypothetical protein
MLPGHFGVGLPGDPVIRQELIDDLLINDLPADEIDRRLADDSNVRCRVQFTHGIPFPQHNGIGLFSRGKRRKASLL